MVQIGRYLYQKNNMKKFLANLKSWASVSTSRSILMGVVTTMLIGLPFILALVFGIPAIPESDTDVARIVYALGVMLAFIGTYIGFVKFMNKL